MGRSVRFDQREFHAIVLGRDAVPFAGSDRRHGIWHPRDRVDTLPGDEFVKQAATASWESETIGDAAAARLKALGRAMSPADFDREAIAAVVGNDFRCAELRPPDIQVVFQDDTFTVRRPPPAARDAKGADAETTGVARLTQALTRLLGPLSGADEL